MPSFVAAVFTDHVVVKNPSAELKVMFPTLSFNHADGAVLLGYEGESALAILLSQLQSLGIPFVAGGPGWHPAAVFQYLREKALVRGSIQTIVWRAPGESCSASPN